MAKLKLRNGEQDVILQYNRQISEGFYFAERELVDLNLSELGFDMTEISEDLEFFVRLNRCAVFCSYSAEEKYILIMTEDAEPWDVEGELYSLGVEDISLALAGLTYARLPRMSEVGIPLTDYHDFAMVSWMN